jgi:peptide/nickel transport system permease protein
VLPYLAPEGLRDALLGPHADEPVAVAQVERDEHLDVVAPARYVLFVAGVAHGDFGNSYVQPIDVERELLSYTGLTVVLVAAAWFLTRNRFGPAVVFAVLALEAVLGWHGLGRLFANAVDRRDLVVVRAVLAVVLLGCVAMPRARDVVARAIAHGWVVLAGAWLSVLVLAIAFAQRLPLPDPDALAAARRGPSGAHWFGTDDVGHDVAARLLWGAQGTLLVALAAVAVGCLVGVIVGALAAERRGARRAVQWAGRAGIPAVGIAVGLAAVLSREPFVMWQWLVPVTIGPATAWATATFALAGERAFTFRLPTVAAVVAVALANAVAAEAVLGALGCVPPGTVTWGALLDDVRLSARPARLELMVVVTALVATVWALRTVAAALREPSRRLAVAASGTMAP